MATEKNFQATDPAAPAGARNIIWQVDPTAAGTDATTGQPYFNTSAYLTDMVGDSGSGGHDGLVPAPPAGSAAAGKFLKADGTFAVPASVSPLTTKGDLFGHSTVDARIPVGTNGQALIADSSQTTGVRWADRVSTAGITIDGGGSTPATGSKGFLQIPFAGTITGWTLIADVSGSASITVKKSTFAAFPTNSSIVASAPPALSSQQNATSTTLTGWTTAVAAGDVLEFVLASASTLTRLTLELQITRS